MMNNKYESLFRRSELRRCLRGGPRNFRLLVFILVFLFSTVSVLAQGSTPGQGYGAIATDAAFNLSVGTSTTQSNTKFLLVASSTGSSDFVLKILQSTQTPIFFVRNDGGISIGTTTVTAGQLTVQGNLYATGSLLNGGVQATQMVPGLFGGASNYAFPSGLGISTTSASLPSGVALAVYGTSTFFGNVGIGTTSPLAVDGGTATKFHVDNGAGTGNIEVARFEGGSDADNTYGVVRIGHANDRGFFVKGGRQTGDTPIATMGLTDAVGTMTDIMTFLNGNVGIGTTAPSSTLHVVGNVRITGSASTTNFAITSLTSQSCLGTDAAGKLQAGSCGGSSQWTSASGGIYYPSRVSVGTTTLDTYALLVATSSDNLFAIKREGAAYPTIFKQGTDGALVINNSSTDTLTLRYGNVGIRTTSPGALLDIMPGGYLPTDIGLRVSFYGPNLADFLTNVDIPGKVRISGGGTSNGRSGLEVYNFNPTAAADAIYGEFKAGYDGSWTTTGVYIASRRTGAAEFAPLMFYTNDVERMRIATSGYVGIGTTTPAYNLVVSGNSYVTGNAYFSSPSYYLNNGSANLNILTLASNQLHGGSGLSFYSDTTNIRMTIASSGYVGIGTTVPSSTLHVVGNVRITGSASTTNFAITSLTSQSCLGTDAAGKLQAGSCGGSSQWTSASGGIYYPSRVSVGTTTLDTYALLVATSSDNLFAIKREGAAYPTIFKQGTDGALVINNSSTDTLTLKSGKVGIGTASPQLMLHVSDGTASGMSNPVSGYASMAITDNSIALLYFEATGATSGQRVFRIDGGGGLLSFGSMNDASTAWVKQNILNIKYDGSIGIGKTDPQSILHVRSNHPTLVLEDIDGTSNTTQVLQFQSQAIVLGSVNMEYGRLMLYTINIRDIVFAPNQTVSMVVKAGSGFVGIGESSPGYELDVMDHGSTTARFGTVSTAAVTIGGGSGKLTVGTVDPIYTIGGNKYATYLPGMTGQKEETTGVAHLRRLTRTDTQTSAEIYGYTIDFNNLEKGSDLWLFSKVTDLKNNFDKLVALLTASFDGRVWYEKDSKNLLLKIFAATSDKQQATSLEVSYRLSAPRFDAASWPNISSDPSSGFIITD